MTNRLLLPLAALLVVAALGARTHRRTMGLMLAGSGVAIAALVMARTGGRS